MVSVTARQIAELINEHSPLATPVRVERVERDLAMYIRSERDGLVGAFAKLTKVSWYQGEISHVVARPEYRRQRQGTRVVNMACTHAEQLGLKIVQCTIRDGNIPSEGLFISCGFQAAASFTGRSGHPLTIWQKVL